MEIAEQLTMRPTLIAVAKHNLGDHNESVAEFGQKQWFTMKSVFNLLPDEPTIQSIPVSLQYDAVFDVIVRILLTN